MKIIVFGATGGTGSNIVRQALEAGHDVTAVARNPFAITLKHPQLEIVHGDVLASESLVPIISRHDAVVSALGANLREPTILYSIGITNILNAMKEIDVRRLLCISAGGLDPGPLLQRLIAKPLLWWVFKNGYTDMARMEALLQDEGLNWTILRAPRLTDNPRMGKYHTAVNTHLSSGWSLSRADLADYLVVHLNDPTTYRAIVEIAY